ncbi:response regulator [Sulfurovum sp.]|uniref:response regulator n=1 Tax=Sulfurovum sp. TaxID=1969726 RepID=UPI0025DFA528|nr:response regulator [Sulfurovum sp.]
MHTLLRYLLFSVLFSTLVLSRESVKYTETSSNTSIFVLIIIIMILVYLFYKAIPFYRSLKEKNIYTKKEDASAEASQEQVLDTGTALPDENEVKDLINFLKTHTQKFELHNKVFRVQDLVNELHRLVAPVIQKNHIEFIYDIDYSVPIELVGDSLVLEQVLYNLLSHALECPGHCNVLVKFKKKNQENEQLIIEILSTTKSISEEEIQSLLSYSEEKDSTKNPEGSDFYTTHKLIQLMDGKLTIENREQMGTLYRIVLPFLHNEFYQEVYYSLPSTITGKKVLLIEDNLYTANIISQMFKYFHLDIKVENSDRLSEIQNFDKYDMIILDANKLTPVLMRHLEEIKEHKKLKVVFLQALTDQQNKRYKPNALIDKYLHKPLTQGMVHELLYETYVIQANEHFVIDEGATAPQEQPKRTGEIVFIEETANITRDDFQDFDNIHILVAEDNKINQKILQGVLEKSKIKLTIANHGLEALAYLDKDKTIDMVLMDINMPIMDGYQTTQKIREDDTFSSLPIVVISGLDLREEIEKMYLAGADAHLTKPFKIGQLYTAFKRFLSHPASQENSIDDQIIQYTEDKNILDIKKGIASTQNVLGYRDALREALVMLKHTDETVKEMIIKKEFNDLYDYCINTAKESEYIGAVGLNHILNEMIILIRNKEEALLQTYIALYHDEWIKTKRHIELYLKSVKAF